MYSKFSYQKEIKLLSENSPTIGANAQYDLEKENTLFLSSCVNSCWSF